MADLEKQFSDLKEVYVLLKFYTHCSCLLYKPCAYTGMLLLMINLLVINDYFLTTL